VRTVFVLGEVAAEDRGQGEDVEVVCGDAAGMEILGVSSRLEVDAGGPGAGGGREESGNVVAEELPLLPVDMVALVGGAMRV
jgi:hypothetical protein